MTRPICRRAKHSGVWTADRKETIAVRESVNSRGRNKKQRRGYVLESQQGRERETTTSHSPQLVGVRPHIFPESLSYAYNTSLLDSGNSLRLSASKPMNVDLLPYMMLAAESMRRKTRDG